MNWELRPHPFDPKWKSYFLQRALQRKFGISRQQAAVKPRESNVENQSRFSSFIIAAASSKSRTAKVTLRFFGSLRASTNLQCGGFNGEFRADKVAQSDSPKVAQ